MSQAVQLQGLPPLVNADTRVLVLGSFPGVKSLQLQQYYAHPQNQFWRIMQSLWPDAPWPTDRDYARRCQCLLAQGVGVWDVYAQCEREGSLDSAIRSAQLNDFPALLQRCPRLSGVAHNGGESFRHAQAVKKSWAQKPVRPSSSLFIAYHRPVPPMRRGPLNKNARPGPRSCKRMACGLAMHPHGTPV